MTELEELDVGELDDLERVGARAVRDESGGPVQRDEVGRAVRKAQASRLADLRRAQWPSLEPDKTGDPCVMSPEPLGRFLLELEDDVFFAEGAHLKLDDHRPDPLEPGRDN